MKGFLWNVNDESNNFFLSMKDAKRLLERELDTMYYNKSSLIVGHKYVRSIVMKFLKGGYKMSYLTSTTSTTTTSTTTSTTTTVPQRGRRQVNFIKEKILKKKMFLLGSGSFPWLLLWQHWREKLQAVYSTGFYGKFINGKFD